ncbi:MAG: thiamine phosphate synthase [SAR324 cluster bacterium]|nr:thiamine phosphate synthase [SAR324 cluster bacterium]
MAGLYAIVGDIARARFMLEARVPYLQLRFKSQPLAPFQAEISRWRTEFPETRLIINDDLEFAERVNAWGVHLGQDDLRRYSKEALTATSLQLGISTHSDEAIALAMEYGPAMLGFGPMFATTSKETNRPPQGVARLREVVAGCSVPVVAIGGIKDDNLDEVVGTGVAMVAMIAYLDSFSTAAQLDSLIMRMQD